MKYLLALILYLIIPYKSNAQISNDSCTNPLPINNLDSCYTIINNQTLTLAGATPQGRFGFCTALGAAANNAWFSFSEPSCFLEISANALNGNINDLEISVFTDCQINAVACETESLLFTNFANANYLISITSASNASTPFELCFSSVPPISNDSFNEAQILNSPIGSCTMVNGTNLGACFSFGTSICNFSNRSAWYKTLLEEGQSAIQLELIEAENDVDLIVEFGTLTTLDVVRFNPIFEYCGPADTTLIYAGLNSYFEDYYLRISTIAEDAGSFNFCIASIPADPCATNNFCEDAIRIENLITDENEVCIQGCNKNAFGAEFDNPCSFEYEETVWYKIIPDSSNTYLQFSYSSPSLSNLNLTLFEGSCSNLDQIRCITLSNNESGEFLSYRMQDSAYYLAVSSTDAEGGDFELCIQSITLPNECVNNATLIPLSTSLGSPLNGPYLPDEVVAFKYRINEYNVDKVAGLNNCTWLQGIVPQFGNGWDPNSFSSTGEPLIASPPSQQYLAEWNWWDSVTINFATDIISIGNFDNDPELEICSQRESDCSNTGIQANTILPAGWFAVNTSQGDNPNVTFGDGENCDTILNGWEVTFQLKTRTYSPIEPDSFFTDCSVKIYTFTDGATGSWIGPTYLCESDRPSILRPRLNNCQTPTANFSFENIDNRIQFTNSSERFDSCLWNFGDGNISMEINPIHEYDSTGSYEVELICYNDCSTDSSRLTVEIIISSISRKHFLKDLKIIPNPNTGSFLLEFYGQPMDKVQVSLWSMEGKFIRDGGIHNFNSGTFAKSMMFGSVPKGIYLLKISAPSEQTIFKKVVVQE